MSQTLNTLNTLIRVSAETAEHSAELPNKHGAGAASMSFNANIGSGPQTRQTPHTETHNVGRMTTRVGRVLGQKLTGPPGSSCVASRLCALDMVIQCLVLCCNGMGGGGGVSIRWPIKSRSCTWPLERLADICPPSSTAAYRKKRGERRMPFDWKIL